MHSMYDITVMVCIVINLCVILLAALWHRYALRKALAQQKALLARSYDLSKLPAMVLQKTKYEMIIEGMKAVHQQEIETILREVRR